MNITKRRTLIRRLENLLQLHQSEMEKFLAMQRHCEAVRLRVNAAARRYNSTYPEVAKDATGLTHLPDMLEIIEGDI